MTIACPLPATSATQNALRAADAGKELRCVGPRGIQKVKEERRCERGAAWLKNGGLHLLWSIVGAEYPRAHARVAFGRYKYLHSSLTSFSSLTQPLSATPNIGIVEDMSLRLSRIPSPRMGCPLRSSPSATPSQSEKCSMSSLLRRSRIPKFLRLDQHVLFLFCAFLKSREQNLMRTIPRSTKKGSCPRTCFDEIIGNDPCVPPQKHKHLSNPSLLLFHIYTHIIPPTFKNQTTGHPCLPVFPKGKATKRMGQVFLAALFTPITLKHVRRMHMSPRLPFHPMQYKYILAGPDNHAHDLQRCACDIK